MVGTINNLGHEARENPPIANPARGLRAISEMMVVAVIHWDTPTRLALKLPCLRLGRLAAAAVYRVTVPRTPYDVGTKS